MRLRRNGVNVGRRPRAAADQEAPQKAAQDECGVSVLTPPARALAVPREVSKIDESDA
jgi:hypothetical protein